MENHTHLERTPETGLSLAQILLIGGIVIGAFSAAVVLAAWYMIPPPPPPNLAREAEMYLRQRKAAPLSAPLTELLSDPDLFLVETQEHPLLGKPAPDFELTDHLGRKVRLSKLLDRGPVVLIFYYGYWCDHCVAQLFGVHEDIRRFQELGASVVAVSADPSELTKERFEEYGAFAYPTLSDPDNEAAEKFHCKLEDPDDGDAATLHGTFVIGRDRVVHWANTGHRPFLGNATLLFELARLEGRLPERNSNVADNQP